MIKPRSCPYCDTYAERARPHEIRVPRDKQDEPQPVGMVLDEEASLLDEMTYTTMSCQRLDPCGHIYRQADVEKVERGEITMRELGDRVQNPGHDY